MRYIKVNVKPHDGSAAAPIFCELNSSELPKLGENDTLTLDVRFSLRLPPGMSIDDVDIECTTVKGEEVYAVLEVRP